MSKRQAIPKPVQREVLFRNRNVCCICQRSRVQIHHIDGDPSNNDISNLAVLCIEHHAEAEESPTMTKTLDAALVKKFKNEWEALNARKLGRGVDEKDEIRRALNDIELRRIIYALPGQNKKRFEAALHELFRWVTFENSAGQAMSLLGDVRWFLEPDQMRYLAEKTPEFFWQFLDPKQFPMNDEAAAGLTEALTMVTSMGVQMAIMEETENATIDTICDTFYDLLFTAEMYGQTDVCVWGGQVLREMQGEWAAHAETDAQRRIVEHVNRRVKAFEQMETLSNNFQKRIEWEK